MSGRSPAAGGPDGGLPASERVRRHLAARIRSGAIAPGAVLPSTRRLAADWVLDATTVSRAYRRLAPEGLVAHVRGTRRWIVPAGLTSPPPG